MEKLSPFLTYLAKEPQDGDKLPPLNELSQRLGISIPSLREQMEVARSLGWVEVRPKTGIRRLPYCFKNTLSQSIQYGHTVDSHLFSYFSDLRKHIEASYWFQAVNGLSATDIQNMEALVFSAEGKLSRNPVQIPHQEHRELHMTIFKKLDNPLVVGILAAYWDLYEMVGYSLYTDLDYLKNVWNYHKKIVNHLKQGELQLGYRALLEHMDLLSQRERTKTGNHFE